jgi:hypothetical protein
MKKMKLSSQWRDGSHWETLMILLLHLLIPTLQHKILHLVGTGQCLSDGWMDGQRDRQTCR